MVATVGQYPRNYPTLLLLAAVVVAVFLFSAAYPPLNWPDEVYKLSTLYITDNPYLRLVDWLQGTNCNYAYTSSPSAGTLNQFDVIMLNGRDCYVRIKNANSAVICVTIAACLFFIRPAFREIFLLSIIWPSSLFYLTSVNNQVVFHVISIALGVYSLYARNLLIPIILSASLIVVDRSFITTLTFFLTLQSLSVSRAATLIGFAVLFFGNQLFDGFLAEAYGMVVGGDASTLRAIAESTEAYRDSIFFSIALFAVSSVYLGGLSSVFGIGLDYLITFSYVIKRSTFAHRNKHLEANALALGLTYIIVLQLVPTIQTFRYYVFILPIAVFYILKREHRAYYLAYCCVMAMAYLFLAYFVQGG